MLWQQPGQTEKIIPSTQNLRGCGMSNDMFHDMFANHDIPSKCYAQNDMFHDMFRTKLSANENFNVWEPTIQKRKANCQESASGRS
jgi:hypothetical protein